MLILINLAFGFASGGSIDNAAHLGGLIAGLWLGALVLPTGVPTLSALWQRPGNAPTPGVAARAPGPPSAYLTVIGVGVVTIVVAAGIALGTADRRPSTGAVEPAAQLVSSLAVGQAGPFSARAGSSAVQR